MFWFWSCLSAPIVLAITYAISSVVLAVWLRTTLANVAKRGDPADQYPVTTTDRRHAVPWGLCFSLAGASLIQLLAWFCFLWTWGLPKVVFYWELFHAFMVLFPLMLSSTVLAVLIMVVSLAFYRRDRRLPFSNSVLHLVASLSLVGASALFWLASVSTLGNRVQVDQMLIDRHVYNLVSYRSMEDHSGVLLYECDISNTLCRQVARSDPDYTVLGHVDGRLIYDSSTNELSAEVTSALRYIGFTYCLREPCSTTEQ
jgi:hypothetical protein